MIGFRFSEKQESY